MISAALWCACALGGSRVGHLKRRLPSCFEKKSLSKVKGFGWAARHTQRCHRQTLTHGTAWQYCRKTSYIYIYTYICIKLYKYIGLSVSKMIYHHEGEEKVLIHKCCVSFTFIYGVCQAELRLKHRQCSSAMYPKASHRAGPVSNKWSYDSLTPSLVSLVSVFFW